MAIRRAAVAELRAIIGRALSAPQYPLLGYNPTERIPPQMPDPYVPPPPPKAAAKRLAIEDVQRALPPPTTPQRRGREQEMPEAQAPKAKQRVITEQEILAEAKQKAKPPKFLPSAQPYIAPPPKISAPEILATATAKPPPPKAAAKRLAIEDVQRALPPPTTPQRRGREQEMPEAQVPKAKQRVITEQEILAEAEQKAKPPKFLPSAQPYIAPPPNISAPEILATQTSKAASPKAQDILATQTSKSKPKGAPPSEYRQPLRYIT